MRQVMPHRNNIGALSRSCKRFLPPLRRAQSKALSADLRLGRDGDVDSESKVIKTVLYAANTDLRRGRATERGDGWYARKAWHFG